MNHQHPQQRQFKRKGWAPPIYPTKSTPPSVTSSSLSSRKRPPVPSPQSNKILAGHMAHEFLTKGTLLSQKFDPARANAVPVQCWKRGMHGLNNDINSKRQVGPSGKGKQPKDNQNYAEVAAIVNCEGTHLPGIVNPTQLAHWMKM